MSKPTNPTQPSPTRHTPGPWAVHPHTHRNGVPSFEIQHGTCGEVVCYVDSTDQTADAALIAAAPDMLTACEAMVHAAKLNDPAMGAIAATLAAAAIAKATGGVA